MMGSWYGELQYQSGHEKMSGNSCAESVVKADKIKLKYGEIYQYQF